MCFIAAKIQLFPETQKGRMKKSYPTCQIGLENLPCDLAGARTQDPHIKSVMLYLLSYQVMLSLFTIATAKILHFPIHPTKIFQKFSNQDTLALTSDKYLIISAIHNSTLLVFTESAIDDDVDTVFVTLKYLLRISQKS